jgi:hypothetical protein
LDIRLICPDIPFVPHIIVYELDTPTAIGMVSRFIPTIRTRTVQIAIVYGAGLWVCIPSDDNLRYAEDRMVKLEFHVTSPPDEAELIFTALNVYDVYICRRRRTLLELSLVAVIYSATSTQEQKTFAYITVSNRAVSIVSGSSSYVLSGNVTNIKVVSPTSVATYSSNYTSMIYASSLNITSSGDVLEVSDLSGCVRTVFPLVSSSTAETPSGAEYLCHVEIPSVNVKVSNVSNTEDMCIAYLHNVVLQYSLPGVTLLARIAISHNNTLLSNTSVTLHN